MSGSTTKPKKKQKPKAGRVIRIDAFLKRYFEGKRGKNETFSEVIRRELDLQRPALFALEADLFSSKGDLIIAAARRKIKAQDLRVRKVREVR